MKFLYLLVISIIFSPNLFATQWSVSNDPLLPAQFSSIQAAIDSVADGDTLIIAGSATNYSGFTLNNKGLTFIGEGNNNPDGQNTFISGNVFIKRVNELLSASNSSFEGIHFFSSIQMDGQYTGGNINSQILENIKFDRCSFNSGINFTSSCVYENIAYLNCIISTPNTLLYFPQTSNYNNISIDNCIFSRGYFSGSSYNFSNELVIKNCIFMERTTSVFSNIDSILIENCIFYKAEPTGADYSTFTNCQTYICNNNTIPYGTNSGTNNLINQNPLFNNYPALGEEFQWSHDYGLMTGSPSIGAGTGGTNIGLTGGDYPVNQMRGYSKLPVVIDVSLPNSSVPLNGVLQGNIQAKVRN